MSVQQQLPITFGQLATLTHSMQNCEYHTFPAFQRTASVNSWMLNGSGARRGRETFHFGKSLKIQGYLRPTAHGGGGVGHPAEMP